MVTARTGGDGGGRPGFVGGYPPCIKGLERGETGLNGGEGCGGDGTCADADVDGLKV